MGGSPSTSQATTTNQGPWAGQAGDVSSLLNSSQNLMDVQVGQANPYANAASLYSGINPTEVAGANALNSNGIMSGGYASPLMSAGYGALSGLPTASAAAQNYATGSFNQGSTMAGNIAAAGIPGDVRYGLNGLQMAQSAQQANTPAGIASAASTMANNGVLNGQIGALSGDVAANLGNLPQNTGTGRDAAAAAVYGSQGQQNLSNAAANMRANAYSTGIGLAQGQNATNASGALGLTSAAAGATNAGLYGLSSSNSQVNADNSMMMGGAGLLNSLGGLGSGIMSTGSQLGQSGAMQQLQGGGVMQADANAQDQAALQAYQMFQQQPWTPLQDAS